MVSCLQNIHQKTMRYEQANYKGIGSGPKVDFLT